MSDQGKANYEAYRKLAGRPGVSAHPLPDYEQLPLDLRYAFDAGADAVEQWLADAPVDEDAPGNEPAKVVVVTEVGFAGKTTERHFRADELQHHADAGAIELYRDGRRIALYGHGTWANFRDADAEVPDATAKALGIAKRALKRLADCDYNPDIPGEETFSIAGDALAEIFAETE